MGDMEVRNALDLTWFEYAVSVHLVLTEHVPHGVERRLPLRIEQAPREALPVDDHEGVEATAKFAVCFLEDR
jgi:hypothetical protein